MSTVYMRHNSKDHTVALFHNNNDHNDLLQAVVPFGGSAQSVSNPDKSILGGKGLGLQEMSSIGIDVPPGFTLTTPLCQVYQEHGDLPAELWTCVDAAIVQMEKDMGRQFGSDTNPLLVSCRSGAKVSMPGKYECCICS